MATEQQYWYEQRERERKKKGKQMNAERLVGQLNEWETRDLAVECLMNVSDEFASHAILAYLDRLPKSQAETVCEELIHTLNEKLIVITEIERKADGKSTPTN
jgi:hypothetical protein